jgi:hypothetical protein
MSHPLDPIRRHPDGSIEFDRYRADIHMLRHHAMQDASKLGAGLKVIAAVVVMVIAIAVSPSPQAGDATCRICAGSGHVTASAYQLRSLPARHDVSVATQLY